MSIWGPSDVPEWLAASEGREAMAEYQKTGDLIALLEKVWSAASSSGASHALAD